MKDIYSPLEIDEEWDNYAPAADGGTALMERRVGVSTEGNGLNTEGAMATTVPVTTPDPTDVITASHVMPGSESSNTGTKESTVPDAAYNAAKALIDKPAADADLVATPGPAATSGGTFDINDTRGLVRITPAEPTSDESAPETTIAGTPQKINPVKVNVMGDDTQTEALPEPIDQSNAETIKIGDNTEADEATKITPFITPIVKEENSDDVINTGTINPDTGEKSTDTMVASDDGGESNDDKIENSESDTTDDTESDTAGSSSEAKADKPKVENKDTAPASGDTTIEAVKNDLLKRVGVLNEERGKIQASIEAMEKDKKKYTDDYNEDMAAIGEGIKTANERLADYDKFIAQLESLK